jgi:hypothetical protein
MFLWTGLDNIVHRSHFKHTLYVLHERENANEGYKSTEKGYMKLKNVHYIDMQECTLEGTVRRLSKAVLAMRDDVPRK